MKTAKEIRVEPLKHDNVTAICGQPIDTEKFIQNLGNMLVRLPMISKMVGHSSVSSTVRDYLRTTGASPEDKLAKAFLIDLFTLSVDQIVQKWYNFSDGQDWIMTGMAGLSADVEHP